MNGGLPAWLGIRVLPMVLWGTLCLPHAVAAEAVSGQWHATPNPARVGDSIQLRLTVSHPAGYRVAWGDGPTLPDGLTPVADAKPTRVAGGERDAATWRTTVMADLPGTYTLPAARFPLQRQGQSNGSVIKPVAVPALDVQVTGAFDPENPPPVADPRGPLGVRVGAGWWIGGIALLALLATAVWGWLRRRRPPLPAPVIPEPTPPPRVPADVAALAELAELSERAAGGISPREILVALAGIVRRFLTARYGIPAAVGTTAEIARRVASGDAPGGEEAGPWLQRWDLVKFAELTASPDEARDAIDEVTDWVRRVGPRPVPVALAVDLTAPQKPGAE